MYRVIAFCVVLATTTVGVHGHLFQRWLTRGHLSAPWQPADDAASQEESLPASAVNAALSKLANNTGNNMLYFVETKQELFVSGDAPAPILTPGSVTSTSAPVTSTSAPATSTSAPDTSTSAPDTNTSAPTTSTTVLATSTSAPDTSTSAPTTSTTVPATSTTVPDTSTSTPDMSTSAPTTSTTVPASSTSAPITSTNAPTTSPPLTAPSSYTYSSATGSYYKYHTEEVLWRQANATCADEGGYLVILNDAAEAAVVGKLIRAANEWWTWTGVIDKRPGGVSSWQSIHGEPISLLYHKWAKYRPLGEAERIYAPMHARDLELIDHPEGVTLPFTCEISQ